MDSIVIHYSYSCEYVPGQIGDKRVLLQHEGNKTKQPVWRSVDVTTPVHHLVHVLYQLW